MKQLAYSERTLADLVGILSFIARNNPSAAVAFAEDLISTCESLQTKPELGMLRADLVDNLRLLVHRDYRIYYRNLDKQVIVERVLHHALDESRQSFA